jgi:hypothetical protein
MTQEMIMSEQFVQDPEKILAGMRDRHEHVFAASRQTSFQILDVWEQTLSAVAESQDKLAAMSEVDWLNRLLRAQATFTRELADASGKFAREILQD